MASKHRNHSAENHPSALVNGLIYKIFRRHGFIKFGPQLREKAFFHVSQLENPTGVKIPPLDTILQPGDRVLFAKRKSSTENESIRWEATLVRLSRPIDGSEYLAETENCQQQRLNTKTACTVKIHSAAAVGCEEDDNAWDSLEDCTFESDEESEGHSDVKPNFPPPQNNNNVELVSKKDDQAVDGREQCAPLQSSEERACCMEASCENYALHPFQGFMQGTGLLFFSEKRIVEEEIRSLARAIAVSIRQGLEAKKCDKATSPMKNEEREEENNAVETRSTGDASCQTISTGDITYEKICV